MSVKKLSELVNINSNFKNAINLYLNLNKKDKIDSYVPTNSSVNILDRYIDSVLNNKSNSTVLIGPYGKGKSHLLLVLLAILSMDNEGTVNGLLSKIEKVNKETAKKGRLLKEKNKRFLPVIVMGSQDDLNQTFMIALNNALKRENLQDIMPDTYYSYAIDCIKRWKREYEDTYQLFVNLIAKKDYTEKKFISQLKFCDQETLSVFREIYPKLTAGSAFNPLAGGDVIPMYKSVADRLREEKGYSGIYIIFDEFSKYIESQDKNATGNSMKLLQDLCELANESKETQIFLTMVTHKSIKEYGEHLSKRTINAYTGIEGRIEEVYFITSSKNNYELVQNAIQNDDSKLDEVPQSRKYFSEEVRNRYLRLGAFSEFTENTFESVILRGCYPLSPITAYALLNISEKVAQNERTLFTFISKDEPYSLARYIKGNEDFQRDNWIATPDLVYDYFKNIFKKEVDNELIHNEWLNADYAISKTRDEDKKCILKIIALINIISKTDELSATKDAIMVSSCISNASDLIDELETEKLIYKKSTNNTYTFKTRAGSELRTEIKRRRKHDVDLPMVFEKVSKTQFVMPNKYNYDYSITRYFRSVYMCVDDFLNQYDMKSLFSGDRYQDGIVLFLYNLDNVDKTAFVKKKIVEIGIQNMVFVYTKKVFKKIPIAIDYDVIQLLKKDEKFMSENAVLTTELQIMEEDFESELLSYLDEAFGESEKTLRVYYNGEKWLFDSKLSLNRCVNNACESYYNKTLIINNELINKQNINTAPIKKARKAIVEKILLGQSTEEYLGGTSPESTIFRAVLENTKNENGYIDGDLIDEFTKYIESCVEDKRSLKMLVDIYEGAPYGMRRGVFPILLAHKIVERNDDVVVYHFENEVLLDADLIIDMGEHPQEYSIFISKDSQEKEKYLIKLSELFGTNETESITGNRISDILVSMQRWYRALPQITKNIKTVSEYMDNEVIVKKLPKFRSVMQQFDSNYYEDIFDSIPMLLGNGDFEVTCNVLEIIKTKLDGYLDWFLKKLINETHDIFSKRQDNLIHTLKDWYEQQSEIAKHGLQDSMVTEFMNYVSRINTYDESDVIQKIVRIVSGVYVDSWNDNTNTEYLYKLMELKLEIESMEDVSEEGKSKLVITNSDGSEMEPILFEAVSNGDGAIFKSILEDTLEDFEDLSVNTKVSILVDMINKAMRRGQF